MVVSNFILVGKRPCFKWLQNGDLLRSLGPLGGIKPKKRDRSGRARRNRPNRHGFRFGSARNGKAGWRLLGEGGEPFLEVNRYLWFGLRKSPVAMVVPTTSSPSKNNDQTQASIQTRTSPPHKTNLPKRQGKIGVGFRPWLGD